ncbi:hypothetical protein AZSI13_04670 [Azospira sp. I13]|uniref:sensor histidine kinase n=1 Tax=Azospira sp. I13 TaxID=1765050 RepID=UPI000D40B888|nr:ATP-binding protein [Azospira sp. I13]GBG01140.1 hypothetical protein AZSI13_04670 [Azospira sp. I13]
MLNWMSRLLLRQEVLLVVLLAFFYGALALGPRALLGQGLWLVHVGLFILWQPFVETARRLSALELVGVLGGVALLTFNLNLWLLIFWTATLAAVVGGRVLYVRQRRQRIFLLLAFGYLLVALLGWLVPQVVPQRLSPASELEPLFRYALPLLLLLMLLWPRTASPAPVRRAEMVDFVYSLFVLLLLAVLVLGSLAFMLLDGTSYGASVASTVLVMALLLFLLAWAWDPRGGFAGFGVFFSRYLMSVALPFEQWMRRLTLHAEREADPELFLTRTLEELLVLPWMVGGEWRAEHRSGTFGGQGEFQQTFECPPLSLSLSTRHKLSPALILHFHLLLRLLAEFYLAKLRGRTLQQMSYVQAVHETGARLTHDVKNLLQSLTNLCHVAETAGPDDAERFQALMQRQLPMVTQRLRQTLDKLEQRPDASDMPEVLAADWWSALVQRYANQGVAFTLRGTLGNARVPASAFDAVADNLLQNALGKRVQDGAGLPVTVSLSAPDTGRVEGLVLRVEDEGSPVAETLVDDLGRAPVASASGLGIGLYQAARLAAGAGYELSLEENRPGRVCFRLALPSP